MAQQFPAQYGVPAANPWMQGPATSGLPPQTTTFVPSQQAAPHAPGGAPGMVPIDPFLTGVAGNMLRQQGQSYLQRGQAFMQSKMGFLSGSTIQYLFNVHPHYVRSKLFMLAAPFLRRWKYSREPEHMAGGHKYAPPSADVNAPDLYLPLMALWTYAILIGVAVLASGAAFSPEVVYSAVSTAIGAWAINALLLKALLYVLGISGAVPLLELAAYGGYPFVGACACLVAHMCLGTGGYHVVWGYASLCMAVFTVRSLKRVIFQEARAHGTASARHNYLLLAVAVFQFPFNAWLARLPVGIAAP